MNFQRQQLRQHTRHGWVAPVVALSLVMIMGAVALVLDRLWLDMATEEALSVAESAALAAGRELASDDDLRRPEPTPEARIAAATLAAQKIGALNHVAGEPYQFDPELGELQFGQRVTIEETGVSQFVKTIHQPRRVRATAYRSHAKGNPVALFFRGLTNVPAGEVRAVAEAYLDNHIVGFQCVGEGTVPMLPLAILAIDPTGRRQETWNAQIDQRRGLDEYRFDPSTGEIHAGSDGIPEIVLTPPLAGAIDRVSNVTLIDIHGQTGHFPILEQVRRGWDRQDLERRDGRFVLTHQPELLNANPVLSKSTAGALEEIRGECRAVLLYLDEQSESNNAPTAVLAVGLVAGRIMDVRHLGAGQYQLVLQPGVLATRTAVRPVDLGIEAQDVRANPYIYQLKLSQ